MTDAEILIIYAKVEGENRLDYMIKVARELRESLEKDLSDATETIKKMKEEIIALKEECEYLRDDRDHYRSEVFFGS